MPCTIQIPKETRSSLPSLLYSTLLCSFSLSHCQQLLQPCYYCKWERQGNYGLHVWETGTNYNPTLLPCTLVSATRSTRIGIRDVYVNSSIVDEGARVFFLGIKLSTRLRADSFLLNSTSLIHDLSCYFQKSNYLTLVMYTHNVSPSTMNGGTTLHYDHLMSTGISLS